ncbi:NADH-ubiquinone oxidoreductase-F iron-sulfur binding region domain-containing protein [Halobaculum limi]|uniref:NADH-ubiquinone oxidoreductase-F iron-sulfur binding region domain-containing protein n=1 Tax=Halobaculum limi TaxID=3031916 RepID=UPI00240520A2|nr:NADH-ubiquinone oxidoreductase-F iron-sulfur binding region domain-containing protein [Halobaculum sp. YSMS11]
MSTSHATTATVRVAFDDADGEAAAEAAERAAADADGIVVRRVGSPGTADLPAVAVTRDGRTALLTGVDTDEAAALVASVDAGEFPNDEAVGVVDHDPETMEFPFPEGPLSVGVRRTLVGAGWLDPTAFDPPTDGDAGDTGLSTLSTLGLRGRGWGDAAQDDPVAAEWRTARAAEGDPVVVVNGLDADPKVDADRLLLSSLTGRVFAGVVVAARAVDVSEVVVALPEDDPVVAERVRAVADVVEDETRLTVEVTAAQAAYMTAEPTALLESLEGNDRIEARRRPPAPAAWGLFERPTLVHTPRTLAAIERAVADPAAYDAGAADPGTRLVTVVGDRRRTVELPTDASLSRALVEGECGAFACVGGRFGGVTRDLDTPVAAPALRGAGLGTNGSVEPFSTGEDGACAVAVAGRRIATAREENCGRCVPCREGSTQAHERLRAVYNGDLSTTRLRELARTMRRTSLCGFGRDAARPLASVLSEFEADLRAHADGRCPAGVCDL